MKNQRGQENSMHYILYEISGVNGVSQRGNKWTVLAPLFPQFTGRRNK